MNSFFFFKSISLSSCRKFGLPCPGKAQQLRDQCRTFLSVCAVFLSACAVFLSACAVFLSVCAVFSHVQTMVWLSVLGIFNVRTDVNARDFAQRERERVINSFSLSAAHDVSAFTYCHKAALARPRLTGCWYVTASQKAKNTGALCSLTHTTCMTCTQH